MSSHIEHPSQAELENLFVNNRAYEEIAAYLDRFNPIRVMRMERMEVRHSSILAWLLDPAETHGLADKFLKAFLAEALRGESALGSPTALDIIQADLRDVEVRREWQNIDIFLLSRRNNWAFIIENKFDARQHGDQLVRYMSKVRSTFEREEGRLDIRGIFLTLHDEEPEDASYAPIGYGSICELLTGILNSGGEMLDRQVRTFLDHYVEIIREAAGMSEERERMEQLARSLYRSHRKALDFIIRHGATTNFAQAVDLAFGEGWQDRKSVEVAGKSLVKVRVGGDICSFIPAAWQTALGGEGYRWPGLEKWWSGYPLACWLSLSPGNKGAEGTVSLFAEVGPVADPKARKTLIEGIQAVAAERNLRLLGFQRSAANEGKKFSKFLKGNFVAIKDIHDVEEISGAVVGLLEKFGECFDVIAPSLQEFMTSHEANHA